MAVWQIDTRNSLSAALFMGSEVKTEFGTGEVSKNKQGLTKWAVSIAASFLGNENGGRMPKPEVLSVSIASSADPGAGIPVGSPVEVDGLRVGVTPPEVKDGRTRGGSMWYQAVAIRSPNGRPAKAE